MAWCLKREKDVLKVRAACPAPIPQTPPRNRTMSAAAAHLAGRCVLLKVRPLAHDEYKGGVTGASILLEMISDLAKKKARRPRRALAAPSPFPRRLPLAEAPAIPARCDLASAPPRTAGLVGRPEAGGGMARARALRVRAGARRVLAEGHVRRSGARGSRGADARYRSAAHSFGPAAGTGAR